ncbi:DUF4489 domain-containing protein [Wukongibacter baidiensis]|uniref:DUF4489 domain-containing protein n=1 Tax=Wukongibacter baidiensis TaxID=1723361 RepID=UPI003D7FE674
MSGYMKGIKDRDKKAPCDCEKDTALAKCDERLSPCPKGILNVCGISGGRATFTSPDNPSVVLARVNVDVSCFKRPEVKIKFTSQVRFEGPLDVNLAFTTDSEVLLDYTLVAIQNGSEANIGNWVYRRLFPVGTLVNFMGTPITTTDTFSFNKCICQASCLECITYFVRVKARIVSQGEDPSSMQDVPNARATVFQGQIIASVQEMC